MSQSILAYQGGYSFGILEVDSVRNVSQATAPEKTALWIRKLQSMKADTLPGCVVYCSNKGMNFNQVKVQNSYEPHLFIWRSTQGDYIRAISGTEMKQLIQRKNPVAGVEEVALNLASVRKEDTGGRDKVITTALLPFAAACAAGDEVEIQRCKGALLEEMKKACFTVTQTAEEGENGSAV